MLAEQEDPGPIPALPNDFLSPEVMKWEDGARHYNLCELAIM